MESREVTLGTQPLEVTYADKGFSPCILPFGLSISQKDCAVHGRTEEVIELSPVEPLKETFTV